MRRGIEGMHTLYIDGPPDDGPGVYHLLADTGDVLAGHYCSNIDFARFDLVRRRTAQHDEWRERFGEYRVVRLGADDMTQEELLRRNQLLAVQQQATAGEDDR